MGTVQKRSRRNIVAGRSSSQAVVLEAFGLGLGCGRSDGHEAAEASTEEGVLLLSPIFPDTDEPSLHHV